MIDLITENGTRVTIHRHNIGTDNHLLTVAGYTAIIGPSDAHKLADWIKENIPEPSTAPPEWRIETGDGEATLMIGAYQAVWLNKTGEFCGDSTASFSQGRITPELHKEMICALLDAHYELHKGES